MAESKVSVLMRISKANLTKAEKRFKESEFDSAVFHASMAVETAANAMILRLGGSEARDHRAIFPSQSRQPQHATRSSSAKLAGA